MENLQTIIKNGLVDGVLQVADSETGTPDDFRYDEEDDYFYSTDHRTLYEEYLCFIGDDLVFYREVQELIGYKPVWDENGYECERPNEEWIEYIEVIGKNDEIHDHLLDYIQTGGKVDYMSFEDILHEWEESPKYHEYIKNNFKDFFVK